MNKQQVLKELFLLQQEDIIDIYNILNGYNCTVNKSKRDNFATRLVYMNGYHSLKEFYKNFNFNRDESVAKLVSSGNSSNIKTYIKLKKMLMLDDEMFCKLLSSVENKIEKSDK